MGRGDDLERGGDGVPARLRAARRATSPSSSRWRSPTPRRARSWPRRAPASSRRATPSGGGSSATCTTARSSGWSPCRSSCGWPSASSPTATPSARPLLEQASAELADALQELRELARGIHPAILTDRGLGPALQMLAGRASLPVEVSSRLEGRLPQAVEAAAFYIVAEALTNSSKYARASRVRVRVDRDGRHGRGRWWPTTALGGADPAKGSGLRGLARSHRGARRHARGGEPARGGGTTLRALMPASEQRSRRRPSPPPGPGARGARFLPALRLGGQGRLPALHRLPELRLPGVLQPEARRVRDPARRPRQRHPAATRLRPRRRPLDVPRWVRRPRGVGRGRGAQGDPRGARAGRRADRPRRRVLASDRARRARRLRGAGARRAAHDARGDRGAGLRASGRPVGRARLLVDRASPQGSPRVHASDDLPSGLPPLDRRGRTVRCRPSATA